MSLLPIPFSNPYTYAGHSGVDFPQPKGTPFRASGPGYVSSIDYSIQASHTVWVQYDNGPNVGYCHMDFRTTDVAMWGRVYGGTILGRVGKLGKRSTGYHLHVEIAGHATTAGFWKFFDPNRVVSQGSTAGGETPMPTPAPIKLPEGGNMFLIYDAGQGRDVANRQYILVTVDGGHIRGKFLDDPYERAVFLAARPELPVTTCDTPTFNGFLKRIGYEYGKPIPLVPVAANATITDAQVKAIADAVAAQIGQSDVTIDYEKVADSVRDRFRTDPLK